MQRHPRHREILKRLAGAWKNKKRSFYATRATPTAVLNAFAIQGHSVVCHRSTHDGEKMFWTLQLVV
ncbi:hypothetical protein AAVH_32228 [Aphelenchoides avenae]|nr:hypothetical protein AAVH_32228 [Aphelenchus avenae]